MLYVKHSGEWLAYSKCSVNISSSNLNQNRCPFTTPTGLHTLALNFSVFPFHHSQFGLVLFPAQFGTQSPLLRLLPRGVLSSLPPPTPPSCCSFCDHPQAGMITMASQLQSSQIKSILRGPTHLSSHNEIPSVTFLCSEFSKLPHCLLTTAFKPLLASIYLSRCRSNLANQMYLPIPMLHSPTFKLLFIQFPLIARSSPSSLPLKILTLLLDQPQIPPPLQCSFLDLPTSFETSYVYFSLRHLYSDVH